MEQDDAAGFADGTPTPDRPSPAGSSGTPITVPDTATSGAAAEPVPVVPARDMTRTLSEYYADVRASQDDLREWTVNASHSLNAVIVALWREAATELARQHWIARSRLVAEQRRALDAADRDSLIAQQEAWLEQFYALQNRLRAPSKTAGSSAPSHEDG